MRIGHQIDLRMLLTTGGCDMTRRSIAKRAALAGTAALWIVLVGGRRDALHADDKSAGEGGCGPAASQARALVEALEGRVHAAEADLTKARELLTTLEGVPMPAAGAEEVDTGAVEGVWRIVGINGNGRGGDFEKAPYDEYKIMTAGHYLWLSFDPRNGAVLRSGGGTYAIQDGVYTAHVDYSNAPDLKAVTGQEYKGTCRLDGKRWYHYGKMTNGAVFDELWERVH